MEAKGSVDSFSGPEAHFEYTGTIDLPQAGAIARINLVRKGTAALSGSGEYKAGHYQTSGKLTARDVDYADGSLQVRNAALSSDFRADDTGLQLTNLNSRLLGGALTGAVEIKTAASTGRVQLKLAGLSLAEVSRLLSTRDLPLERLKPVGSVNGEASFAWKGAPSRGVVEFALALAPPAQKEAGQLAPSGTSAAPTIYATAQWNFGRCSWRPRRPDWTRRAASGAPWRST